MKHFNLLLALPLTVASCGKSSSESAAPGELPVFDRLGLLKQISTGVIQPRYARFVDQTRLLQEATDTFCQNLASGSAWATAAAPAQSAWKNTMALWQEIEPLQFGPLADNESILRYDIYTWPLVNACAVDAQVALMVKDAAAYTLSTNDGTKSLTGMEYLLFDNDSLHACKANATETQGWNEKSETSRQQARCGYLRLLAADLATQADTLQNKWNDGSQGYHYQLVAAGSDAELQSRINGISDSLFFLDADVKDKKLGAPLGLHDSCSSDVCPDLIEHVFSQQSLVAIEHNLIGFEDAIRGGDGLGFDDYLTAVGGETLMQAMQANLQKAIATADALADQGTLTNAISSLDPAACAATTVTDRKSEVCALYQDIKAVTDELKTEFVEILKLTTPAQVSGDND